MLISFSKQKTLIITIFILILLELFTIYSLRYVTDYTEIKSQKEISNLKEAYWEFVHSILIENWDKGLNQAQDVANEIEEELINVYKNDFNKFREDITNPTLNCPFIKISAKKIEGVYLNRDYNNSIIVNRDSNDVFVSTKFGIGPDLSEDCSLCKTELKGKSMRDWNIEYQKHYNKTLALEAQKIIISGNEINFWEFTNNLNPNHKKITKPTLKELKQMFYTEGLEGIKCYEFLPTVRIMENMDLTGIKDVNELGIKNQNHKINVTQGFNLYQQLMSDHSLTINKYETLLKDIPKEIIVFKKFIMFVFVVIGFFLFLSICIISIIYNQHILETELKVSTKLTLEDDTN
jgi:hypothetical protein